MHSSDHPTAPPAVGLSIAPVGCSTFVFRNLDAIGAIEAIAREGFRSLDLCIVPGACPHFDLEGRDASELDRVRAALRRTGLSVSSLNVIVGFLNLPNGADVERVLHRAIDLCAELGAPVLTVPSGQRVDPMVWRDAVELVRPRLASLADHAEKQGVELSVEIPHKGSLGNCVEDAVRFFAQIDDPRVRCTFDTSHIIAGGERSLGAGARAIGIDRINHVHLRDGVGANIQVTPGRGHGDFAGLYEALRTGGYRGAMTLELELRSASARTMVNELREARSFIERTASGRAPTLGERLRSSPVMATVHRARVNPIEEIKRSPRLKRVALALNTHVPSVFPGRVYDGSWRMRWQFPRRGFKPRAGTRPLEVAPERPLRVGIAGCGYAGAIHAYGFRRLVGVEVVGVSDIDPAKAARLAGDLGGSARGCLAYESSLRMIAEAKPDVVSVATGECQHFEIAAACFESGVDVFCEKSLTPTFAEGQRLVEMADQRGRVFGMNYNYRFMPGVQRLRGYIGDGRAGGLLLADIKVHGAAYHHALDLVSYLGGEIAAVRARYVNDDALRPFGMTDWRLWDADILYVPSKSIAVIFEMVSGATIVVTSSFLYDPRRFILGIDLVLERAAASLTGINLYDTVGRVSRSGGAPLPPPPERDRPVFARGYEHSFYKAIESFMNRYVQRRPPETTGRTGLDVLRLERAISLSNTEGRRVLVAEIR